MQNKLADIFKKLNNLPEDYDFSNPSISELMAGSKPIVVSTKEYGRIVKWEYSNGHNYALHDEAGKVFLHREDGPAVEFKDGTFIYYIRGKEVSKENHEKMIKFL